MLDPHSTLMFAEAAEAAAAIRQQHARNADAAARLGEMLRDSPPRVVITLARGSSDNAATFARYLIETHAGVLTSSASPSVSSVYDAAPGMDGTIMLAMSQSGRSPDLVAAATAAKDQGAFLVSLVNDEASPLFALADVALPLCASPEKSVAATKSFIATLAAILHMLAEWQQDARLLDAVRALPDLLEQAWAKDWSAALPTLQAADHLYVVGRGHGFGVAQEMALKFKETCGFHAEAFSAAEIRHGPMALVGPDFPVLLTAQNDESQESVRSLADQFTARGAQVLVAGLQGTSGITLPALEADPLVQPILLVQSFYRMVNQLSVARGRDPDRPPTLAKVTETL
ncbi:SIS domain-containing protein [Sphingomonas crusticola]|uniref:SIS domain-containing protein n=1 Tax=Sphingomonas crusticola TaxID=1697973 RepID=UPI001967B329|nr:SIS domain-containing protein [Sphingomonas crusticola]